ncbi:MAG: amidohydrolase family protein [Nitrosopumilaceae archaeon]|nr:amidohydrolase family protein [Nitrosopumilaceae archaeon]
MILKNIGIFHGNDLDYINSTNLKISGQHFDEINNNDILSNNNESTIDCEGLVLVPGFINAHTHIGDSIAKDINLSLTVNEKVNPIYGMKKYILNNSSPSHLASYMRSSCNSMLKKGITTFVDFREGGIDGIILLNKVLKSVPINCIVLGRIEYYQTGAQIKNNEFLSHEQNHDLSIISKHADGLGISGANEYSDSILHCFSQIPKIRAIHSAETMASVEKSKQVTNKSEIERALQLKPHFIIHMTYASEHDLLVTRKYVDTIVICPRSNATMAEKIPNVYQMMKLRYNIAIGTDNVMLNTPDMFREMDYLWKSTMAINRTKISPKHILKMATVNPGKILHNKGTIKTGAIADCIFIKKHDIDLDPIHDPHAAMVHRASESSIQAVMIDGKIVHGKI